MVQIGVLRLPTTSFTNAKPSGSASLKKTRPGVVAVRLGGLGPVPVPVGAGHRQDAGRGEAVGERRARRRAQRDGDLELDVTRVERGLDLVQVAERATRTLAV